MVWKSAAGDGAAAGFAAEVKMSESETSAFGFPKVSRRRWTSGGAPEPLVRLPPLRLSTRPPRCGWGRGGNGAGALGWVQRLGPVDAPGSGDAVSAPPGCSSKPPRSGGDLSSPWDAPLKPGKRLVWLVPGIKMLLFRVRVLLVTS